MQAEHALSLSAYELLMLLDDALDQGVLMSDIAQRVLLRRGGCTRLAEWLVERG